MSEVAWPPRHFLMTRQPRTTMPITAAAIMPPTLSHLTENRLLGAGLLRTAEQALRDNVRFPHTLLMGPADSSKRAIVACIAKEMAVELQSVDLPTIDGPAELHTIFKAATDRSIVLLSGLDHLSPPAIQDVLRAMLRRERPRPDAQSAAMLAMRAATGERVPTSRNARYADFTLIATMRSHAPTNASICRHFDRIYYTTRSVETEAARLRRLLASGGITISVRTAKAVAARAVTGGMRTVSVANGIRDYLGDSCTSPVSGRAVTRAVEQYFAIAADPLCVQRALRARAAVGTPCDLSITSDPFSAAHNELEASHEDDRPC